LRLKPPYFSVVFSVVLAIVSVFSAWSALAQNRVLTEQELVRLSLEGSIPNKGLDAKAAGESASLSATREMFGPRLKASAGRLQSRETPVTIFQPTLSPIDEYSTSIQQKIPYGLSLEGGVFASQRSAVDRSFEDATQVGAKLALRLELLKNRFGSLDHAQLDAAESRHKRVELETRISKKQQEVAIRKLYWSLVANAQSLELSKKLEESATRQLKYAEDRGRIGAADIGEIARYKSQLQSRLGSILLFEHEREMLWQALQSQIKDFSPAQYQLDVVGLMSTQGAVTQCLDKVLSSKNLDLETSLYDEVMASYKDELGHEVKAAQQHASPQLAFVGSSQITGTKDDYSGSFDDLKDEKRSSYFIGLELEIPLGGKSHRTEESLILSKKSGLEAQYEQLESELAATFQTMEKNLKILQKGLQNQIANSENLDISYRETLKKFDQGRIPLSLAINEQDALFQSELQELTFKKQIAHTLLDYFAVFTEFPCSWNLLSASTSH
jgi:outer membrane protein TolC